MNFTAVLADVQLPVENIVYNLAKCGNLGVSSKYYLVRSCTESALCLQDTAMEIDSSDDEDEKTPEGTGSTFKPSGPEPPRRIGLRSTFQRR